jgi:hypothetical protein
LKPSFVIANGRETTEFLQKRIKGWNYRLENLRVRRFASGRMTMDMLERDLDELRIAQNFEPDMIMVDMPQLMKPTRRSRDQQDYSALDELVTELRGVAVERNAAMVVPQQGNRASNRAKSVQAQHGSGSFGIFGIADNLITYSQTDSEAVHGLARIYTQKVRNATARQTILISQHYDSGQFCMSSRILVPKLRDAMKLYIGDQEDGDDADDE